MARLLMQLLLQVAEDLAEAAAPFLPRPQRLYLTVTLEAEVYLPVETEPPLRLVVRVIALPVAEVLRLRANRILLLGLQLNRVMAVAVY